MVSTMIALHPLTEQKRGRSSGTWGSVGIVAAGSEAPEPEASILDWIWLWEGICAGRVS